MAKRRAPKSKTQREGLHPRFAAVVEAFAGEPGVTYGGKGFGSTALKVNDKLFAMQTSKGFFTVKLPKARVDQLVRDGQARYFETGGRLMKEWASFDDETVPWIKLAQEAFAFVAYAARGSK